MNDAEIEKRFSHHPPDALKVDIHVMVRAAFKELATGLDILPESREKSLAYTALEESLMWANAAIARNDITGVEATVTDENNVTINVDASE